MSKIFESVLDKLVRLPEDYAPFGGVDKDSHDCLDCSCGCIHFLVVSGLPDVGVCACPESHRYGLLTFEHQGCARFELATREVETEFDLDGRAAYNAMMDGETIERVMDRSLDVFVRRKWCDGKFMAQWWIRGNADRWEDLSWGSNDQNAKWRIVKEKQNG